MASVICRLCPRNCGASREKSAGYCRMGEKPKVARAALHFWEEPCISGERGSGAVFFSGCTMGCVFCQNYEVSHNGFGREITPKRLSEIFRELCDAGAHNINLVTPTHFTYAILDALALYTPPVPVVWNSGGYERRETLELIKDAVQIFLPDVKYFSPALSARFSGILDYFSVASEAVAFMRELTGPAEYDEGGMMTRGTVVRHMALPAHTDDSLSILRWYRTLPAGTPLSLMAQYTPHGDIAGFPELSRRLTREEYGILTDALFELGIEEGWVQELSSADEEFIPPFDLSGV